jgi:hypothetical protein
MADNDKPVTIPKRKEPPVLRYLDPEQVRVYHGPSGRVYATISNEVTLLDPRFVRVRPLDDPDRYISIRETDPGRGKEYGLLRNWQALDAESRALVQADLDRRYEMPVLVRITALKDFGGVSVCTFETDRGIREVTLRDARDNVVYLGARILLTDAEGNRYDIPDANALDPRSAQFLAQLI